MGLLLFLVGLLALASGALKLRPRSRAVIGVSALAVAEVVVGALTVVGSGLGLARIRPAAWTAVLLALAFTAAATVVVVRRVLCDHGRREASEAARLRRYLESRGR